MFMYMIVEQNVFNDIIECLLIDETNTIGKYTLIILTQHVTGEVLLPLELAGFMFY